MKRITPNLSLLAAILLLFHCQSVSQPPTSPMLNTEGEKRVLLPTTPLLLPIDDSLAITAYALNEKNTFKTQAVDTAKLPENHQQALAQAALDFDQDLRQGDMSAYYETPGFSIKLLAGSEGSALLAGSEGSALLAGSEGSAFTFESEALEQLGAVYAQTLVFNGQEEVLNVFKGQYVNGNFYFDKSNGINIQTQNTTYLLTLNRNLETVVYEGQLGAPPETEPQPEVTPEPPAPTADAPVTDTTTDTAAEVRRNAYEQALARNRRERPAFAARVRRVAVIPPFEPSALSYTETFARLLRAYPPSANQILSQGRGAPAEEVYDIFASAFHILRERWISDCGAPPPDSGRRYLQKHPEQTAVPPGHQSLLMDKVIADIPELQQALDDKLQLRDRERWGKGVFEAFIADFQERYPEVFERHQWRDIFAPPACIQEDVRPPEDRTGGSERRPPRNGGPGGRDGRRSGGRNGPPPPRR